MEFNRIIQGDAKEILRTLPGGSINCITTSPPYWGLRDYETEPQIWDGDKDCEHEWGNKIITLKHKSGETNPGKESWFKDRGASDDKGNCFCVKCGAWKGNLGLEPTSELYIKHLCNIFDEGKRVLRADGTCWVNLGDTYASSPKGNKEKSGLQSKNYGIGKDIPIKKNVDWRYQNVPQKSLCLIPQRFAIEMVNRGWILRNTIIWHKPNGMPASARDRFTVDFEYLYFFTKSNKTQFWTNSKTGECTRKQSPGIKGIEGEDWEWRRKGEDHKKELKKVSLWRGHDYWFEQQFEPHTTKDDLDRRKNKYWSNDIADGGSGKQNKGRDRREFYGEYGRNKRTVWTIPTQPYPEAHFAVFPEGFIEIPIQAGCPKYVCKKCGLAMIRIMESKLKNNIYKPRENEKYSAGSEFMSNKTRLRCETEIIDKGYTDCGCNEGFEGGIILDPFMGAGTTGVVAKKQGKRYLGIELKEDYIKMANKRIDKTRRTPETLF